MPFYMNGFLWLMFCSGPNANAEGGSEYLTLTALYHLKQTPARDPGLWEKVGAHSRTTFFAPATLA